MKRIILLFALYVVAVLDVSLTTLVILFAAPGVDPHLKIFEVLRLIWSNKALTMGLSAMCLIFALVFTSADIVALVWKHNHKVDPSMP